jgi:hypothetical protein
MKEPPQVHFAPCLTAAKEPDKVIITHFANPEQLEGIKFQLQNEDNKN